MGSKLYVFADLDDTLFTTASKITKERVAESVQVTVATNGNHSYMTPAHQQLLEWITPDKLVAVTARGGDAYSRVNAHYRQGPFSIIANGAVVLDAKGAPDEQWADSVRQALAPNLDTLNALPSLIAQSAKKLGFDVRTWNVEEDVCGPTYCVVKSNAGDNGACLAFVEQHVRPLLDDMDSWKIHRNANNLAILPVGISKAQATRYVIGKLSEQAPCTCVGIGDSLSDMEFMQACDFWMTPSSSQIDKKVTNLF